MSSTRRTIERLDGATGARVAAEDSVVDEAPLAIHTRGAEAMVVMRTPGLRAAQPTFDATGGLHAAGLFDRDGAALAVREDVGRHNAVDKLVGWGLERGVAFAELVLVLSGRLGYELAGKAVTAGIPVIAAVSAPSTLAIDVCERFGVTACAFVRDGRFNVYAHGWRILT